MPGRLLLNINERLVPGVLHEALPADHFAKSTIIVRIVLDTFGLTLFIPPVSDSEHFKPKGVV